MIGFYIKSVLLQKRNTMSKIKDFPIVLEMPIRWGDQDAFNHVNNTMFFRYFESSRIAYFEKIGFTGNLGDYGPILAETKCRFWKPLTYPDTILVGVRTTKIGTSSIIMEHIIESPKSGVAATGEGVVVSYDYKNNKKVPIPKEVREAIEHLEQNSF